MKFNTENSKFNLVDAAIIALNEEENIFPLLENIYTIFDGIVIIDGGSIDHTIDEIKQYKYKYDKYDKIRLYKNNFSHFGDQKNLAISRTNSVFTFVLDCDERLSGDLKKDLQSILIDNLDKDMIILNRYNFIDNQPEELDKEYQYRLFKSFVRYCGIVHEEAVGWNRDFSIILPDNYHLIHNKSLTRSNNNNDLYGTMVGEFPYKDMGTSRQLYKGLVNE